VAVAVDGPAATGVPQPPAPEVAGFAVEAIFEDPAEDEIDEDPRLPPIPEDEETMAYLEQCSPEFARMRRVLALYQAREASQRDAGPSADGADAPRAVEPISASSPQRGPPGSGPPVT
jgi:hypothetical protein